MASDSNVPPGQQQFDHIEVPERAMRFPLQITFRNMSHSNEVEESIRAEAEKLETFYDRITACRVAVEVPHRHHRKGKPVHVRIDLRVVLLRLLDLPLHFADRRQVFV